MSEQIYLNTASCGLLSKESLQTTYALYEGMHTNASHAAGYLRDSGIERIRETIASFLSAPARNIAFIPNFSYGLNAIVQSLQGNENILLYREDYPSLIAPFYINNFSTTWVDADDGFEIDTEALKKTLLQNKIDIFAISHVQWLSGFKTNIEELGKFCREHNIIFIVDATQSLGAVPIYISKQYVDVLICSNYKWMNAGFGTGILYMSDDFIKKYPPVIGGNNSYMKEDGIMKHTPSVLSYEPGHLNLHGLLVLEAAVKYKLGKSIEAIEKHNGHLLQLLLDNVRPEIILGAPTMNNRSAIAIIKDLGNMYERITEHGIVSIKRGNNIRISVHFNNTEQEIEKLITLLNG